MLRRLHNDMGDENTGKLERRRSKRQRVLKFFKSLRPNKPQGHDEVDVRPPVPFVFDGNFNFYPLFHDRANGDLHYTDIYQRR
jgi:hypothetical protein